MTYNWTTPFVRMYQSNICSQNHVFLCNSNLILTSQNLEITHMFLQRKRNTESCNIFREWITMVQLEEIEWVQLGKLVGIIVYICVQSLQWTKLMSTVQYLYSGCSWGVCLERCMDGVSGVLGTHCAWVCMLLT